MSKSNTPQAVGEFIGTTLQGGVLLWAALETEGALRIACWSVFALIALGYIAIAAKSKAAAQDKPRSLYGDVYVSGDRK